jgi:phospholipid-binding lipoprotein MlaA
VGRFERRVRLLEADALLDRAGDPYAFVRSAYLQRREFLVRDGDVPAEDLELEMESEPEEDDAGVTTDTEPKPDAAVTPQGAAASPLR